MLSFLNSPTGNAILGLLLTYALLAAFISSLVEAIQTYLNDRGKTLKDALIRLLDHPDESLIKEFYDHPLISPLKSYLNNTYPSYIDSKNFSKALYELLTDSNGNLNANYFSPNSLVRKYLDPIFTKNTKEEDKLKELEEWFNSAMDRLSGEYKRKTQYITFGLTLTFAVILGLDTFRLSQIYWKMPTEQLNILAQNGLSANKKSIDTPAPPAQGEASAPAQGEISAPAKSEASAREDEIQKQLSDLKELPIQLLWEQKDGHFVWEEGKEIYSPSIIKFFVYLIGCLITASSSLFGAPVLFDLLTKFANVRGTGVKPNPNK